MNLIQKITLTLLLIVFSLATEQIIPREGDIFDL